MLFSASLYESVVSAGLGVAIQALGNSFEIGFFPVSVRSGWRADTIFRHSLLIPGSGCGVIGIRNFFLLPYSSVNQEDTWVPVSRYNFLVAGLHESVIARHKSALKKGGLPR